MREARGGNRVRHVHPPGHDQAVIGGLVIAAGAWLIASTDSLPGPVLSILAVIAAAVWIAQRFGWLPAGSVAKAAQERAELAQRELEVVLQEKHILEHRVKELEQRTDLQPLLDAQNKTVTELREVAEAMRDNSTAIRELARRGTGP